MKALDQVKEITKLVEDTNKAFDTVFHGSLNYRLKIFERYVEGLFSFAKFKEGDKIQLKETHVFDHGWKTCNPTFTNGAVATIYSVDWRKDTGFTYDLVFDNEYWASSSDGIVNVTLRKHAIFGNWSEEDLESVKVSTPAPANDTTVQEDSLIH